MHSAHSLPVARTRSLWFFGFLAVFSLLVSCGDGGGSRFVLPPASQLGLDSIEPNTGPATGGTLVTITGTGFAPNARVRFGSAYATNVVVLQPTELQCETPAGVPSTVDVTVEVGTLEITQADGWTWLDPADVLQLTNLTPTHGPACGGTRVRISGSGFNSAWSYSVAFGGQAATDVAVVSASILECTTPAGTSGTTVDVVVTCPQQGTERLTAAWTWDEDSAPSCDLNADGQPDLVVTAPMDSTVAPQAGAVYVWFGGGGLLTAQGQTSETADLIVRGSQAGDQLGSAVFTGDVDLDGHMDLVVSAAGADVSGLLDAGRVYVFRGPFTGSPQVLFAANAAMTLVEPQPQAGSGFGSAISGGRIEAEDGYVLCVAAPYRDWPQRMDAGCAYRYQLSTTLDTSNAVTLVATLAAQYEGSRAGDLLGAQVLLLPASVVEPESALLVAAPRADPVAGVMLHDAGEVYRLRGARLSLSGTVSDARVWHGESAGDLYGSSMASGDLDGDGLLDVAVGAPEAWSTTLSQRTGRVYLHVGAYPATALVRAGLPSHTSFGQTIALVDVDADGRADLLVGAPRADYLATDNGRGYLYYSTSLPAYLNALGADALFHGTTQPWSSFGRGVTALDLDADGRLDLVWSADRSDSGRGRLHLYRGTASLWSGMVSADDNTASIQGATPGMTLGAALWAVR